MREKWDTAVPRYLRNLQPLIIRSLRPLSLSLSLSGKIKVSRTMIVPRTKEEEEEEEDNIVGMENFNGRPFKRISGKETETYFFFKSLEWKILTNLWERNLFFFKLIKEEHQHSSWEEKERSDSRVYLFVVATNISPPFLILLIIAKILLQSRCDIGRKGIGKSRKWREFSFSVRGDSWYEAGRKSACKQIRGRAFVNR